MQLSGQLIALVGIRMGVVEGTHLPSIETTYPISQTAQVNILNSNNKDFPAVHFTHLVPHPKQTPLNPTPINPPPTIIPQPTPKYNKNNITCYAL